MGRKTVGAVTVGALLVGLGAVQLLPEGSSPLAPAPVQAGERLVAYDSCAPLLQAYRDELARTATPYGWGSSGDVGIALESRAAAGTAAGSGSTGDAAAPAASDSAAAVGNGATGTNVQEKGVDEPDVVKLAGGRLVTVSNGALRVLSAGPVPKELGRLAMPGQGQVQGQYYGGSAELVLDGDRALVIDQGAGLTDAGASSRVPGLMSAQTTVLRLADLSDPTRPRWLETYEVRGSYLSARLVDGTVRLVTRSTPTLTPAQWQGTGAFDQRSHRLQELRMTAANVGIARKATLDEVLPQAVRRDARGAQLDSGAAVGCGDVSYAPGAEGSGLLLVTTMRPSAGLKPLDSTGVRADGELVYATADRLFVATSRWGTSAAGSGRAVRGQEQVSTQLHAFDTSSPAELRYVGTGSVGGYVYGRWALSWHEGALRVATTTGQPWGPGPASSSSVVALRETGEALTEVGRVDGLGKGERIQAVRFLGDLATVVTFRQTDPLYVLDLADPARPVLKGELKVPGFSTYLHPIGDDRLLGIGMEADERSGRTTGVQASVFDLSDLSKPVQVDRLQLGRGYSVALQESRAFGYDPERRLAVLPFQQDDGDAYGLGLKVAADGSLTAAGRVEVSDQQGRGRYVDVRRVVLDGERVHVLTSDAVVTAASADLRRTGSVALS